MMTPEQIVEAARRNRAARLEQIARLQPLKAQAVQRETALHEARQAGEAQRADFEAFKQLRHVPGFFPTPPRVIDEMLSAAGNLAGAAVMEPSAGKGDIARAALEAGAAAAMCIELNYTLAELLKRDGRYIVQCRDFLTACPADFARFDVVLMNPPFEHRADEKHIRHAWQFLAPGGRLVAVASSTTGSRLEDWAASLGGTVEPLPPGSFAGAERTTQVNTCLVVAFA